MPNFEIIFTYAYEKRLCDIEDFIFETSEKDVLAIELFLNEHDRVLDFLKNNPHIPAQHSQTGDQSWPFSDGRYRLFFKVFNETIYLLDLIDNRMSNLRIYPNNVLPTFNED